IQTFDHCKNPGEIALTFNDGPNLEYTNDILDILDKEDIKATFFISGEESDLKNNSKAKKIIKREYKSGHIIASHTYNHPVGISNLSSNELKVEVNELADTIYNIIGVKPAFFRPPNGEFSLTNLEVLENCKITANILWNLDSEDWNSKTDPFTQYVSILGDIDPRVNSFIALHHDEGNDSAIENLPKIISYVKSLGYKFVTMDKCIGMNPY
ncbi:carbohydrate esterase family 4 protein, partial [Piromyces sp. E2]